MSASPTTPSWASSSTGWWPSHGQRVVVEQVSHHPPVSAFHLVNDRAGIHVNGYSGQKTAFTGMSIRCGQQGRVWLYVERFDEEYCMTLPELHVYGIFPAARPYVEITGAIEIASTSNWAARLDFHASKWMRRDSRDTFGGAIFHALTGIEEHRLWGNWKQRMYCAPCNALFPAGGNGGGDDDGGGGNDGNGEEFLLYDVQANPPTRPRVRPLDRQNDYESQRVWLFTTQALVNKDYDRADNMKAAVEEQEGGLRRERAARNEAWVPRLFHEEPYGFVPPKYPASDGNGPGEAVGDGDDDDESSCSGSEEEEEEASRHGEERTRWIHKDFYERYWKPRMSGVSEASPKSSSTTTTS